MTDYAVPTGDADRLNRTVAERLGVDLGQVDTTFGWTVEGGSDTVHITWQSHAWMPTGEFLDLFNSVHVTGDPDGRRG